MAVIEEQLIPTDTSFKMSSKVTAICFVSKRNILTSLSDAWNIPSDLSFNLRAKISTNPFCTINSDWQLNVIYTVGIFKISSVVVGIFKEN